MPIKKEVVGSIGPGNIVDTVCCKTHCQTTCGNERNYVKEASSQLGANTAGQNRRLSPPRRAVPVSYLRNSRIASGRGRALLPSIMAHVLQHVFPIIRWIS